tara:strand:- start:139 stop:426 length:288 start_codon:yes stop_codon:yes gene_type:complete
MQPPRLPSVFKLHKAKPFEFTPRFYDERRERLEEIRKKYEAEGKSTDSMRTLERGSLKSEWGNKESRSAKVGSSNRMLLIIVIALFALTYLILTY